MRGEGLLDHYERMSALSLASTGSTVTPRLVAFAIGTGEGSSRAFEWSCQNLFLADDIIVLIHAYKGGSVFSGSRRAAGARLISRYEDILNERGFSCYRIDLQKGPVVGMICESVRGHGCDMCIVGGSLPGLPGTLKTAIFGSVSLDVARSCSCPLVVVKTGRGVGALLKVIPRRVFLYTERSSDSDSVFDWALTKLINPETDEVYLVRDKASVTEGYPRFEEDQEDVGRKDAERASKDAHADGCIAALRAIGVRTIHRVRNVDSTPSSLLAIATSNSCDLLVTTRNAPGLFAAHNATFPVVVAAPDFETKAATQLEPPAMLQFWGGRIENPASSCDSSVTLSSTLLWEEGETTPTSDARSSHDFGDLEGERERGRTTSFERMLAGLDVSVFEGEGGTCRLSVAATAPSEGEGGGGGGGARAAQLSGGGGVSGGGMSRTNSRWNLALDNCPEEGLGMSCAEAVASVCSEWELEAAPLAFEPRLFEPSFEPVVLGMGAHEMSIQA